MFNLDQLGRAALAMLGTLILTTTFVGAAVGPARAIETAPLVAFEASAAGQINA